MSAYYLGETEQTALPASDEAIECGAHRTEPGSHRRQPHRELRDVAADRLKERDHWVAGRLGRIVGCIADAMLSAT